VAGPIEGLIARVGADITGFEKGMGKVAAIGTRTAKRLALAFAGLTTAAAVVGKGFEFEMMKTATVAQAFGGELDSLVGKARELGKTTAFTAKQAAAGMYDLASAGLNVNEILAATEHSMKLAGATGTQMAQATHLVASSMRQFGLDADETRRIVDTYAAAITGSLFTMEKLTEAMRFAGTTGAALGWEIEETTAAAAAFIDLGLQGSMAGTNLRMSMIMLSKQSPKTIKALAQLGLQFEDINPRTHNFGEILETIAKTSIKAKQAVEIFGARSGLNMLRLIDQAREGSLVFADFVQELKDAQKGVGRSALMYDRMMNTFHGQWKKTVAAAEGLLLEFFDTFKDSGRDLLKTFVSELNKWSDWIRSNKGVIQTFWKGISNAISTAATMAGSLARFMGTIAVHVAAIAATSREAVTGGFDPWGGGMIDVEFPHYTGPPTRQRSLAQRRMTVAPDTSERHRRMAEQRALLAMPREEEELKRTVEYGTAKLDKIKEFAAEEHETRRRALEATGEEERAHILAMIAFRENQKERELEVTRTYEQIMAQTRVTTATNTYDQLLVTQDIELLAIKTHYDQIYEVIKKAGASQTQLDEATAAKSQALSAKTTKHEWAQTQLKMQYASQMASHVSSTLEMMYQSGAMHGKKAFMVLKAVKIVEAIINTASAIIKTLAEPLLPWPSNVAMAIAIGAMGAAQVAMIARQKPPDYYEGGKIKGSRRGVVIRAGEGYRDEAVIPLRSGNIPVRYIGGAPAGGGEVTEVHEHYHFENSNFMDQTVLAATLDTIAVGAIRKDYENDGVTRRMIRGRR